MSNCTKITSFFLLSNRMYPAVLLKKLISIDWYHIECLKLHYIYIYRYIQCIYIYIYIYSKYYFCFRSLLNTLPELWSLKQRTKIVEFCLKTSSIALAQKAFRRENCRGDDHTKNTFIWYVDRLQGRWQRWVKTVGYDQQRQDGHQYWVDIYSVSRLLCQTAVSISYVHRKLLKKRLDCCRTKFSFCSTSSNNMQSRDCNSAMNFSGSVRMVPLTPWSQVLTEKLAGPQLVKKFPAIYGTRRFISVFKSARHLALS
jgi:hypothetical protein